MARATKIELAGRGVGEGAPCFVIAEAGVNHNGDVNLALRLVDAAAETGADAVKFQTFDSSVLASDQAPKAAYQAQRDTAPSQREMLRRLTLSAEAHAAVKARAEQRGILFLSSPFDEGSADLLDGLGVPAFKIPSGETVNPGLLRHVARKGKPMLVSTGMCTFEEVAEAVEVIRAAGAPPLALFHCVSNYPAAPADSNLRAMETLRRAFCCPVGWSDHTLGTEVSIAAAALGAELVEKHLTLDRKLLGPDHEASLEPPEFAQMVRGIRNAAAALGTGQKAPVAAEAAIAAVARKSLHWKSDLSAGERVEEQHLIAMRPGTGLPPKRATQLIGCRLKVAVKAGTLVRTGDVDPAL